jgi:MFS family permease
LPSLLGQSFLFTGFIFHQVYLVESKGWTLAYWGSLFTLYALVSLMCSMLGGYLIDKYGAMRLVPVVSLPTGLGLLLLSVSSHPLAGLGFMLLLGVSSGLVICLSGPFWSEMYGSKNLASIKSMSTSAMVFSSAVSPVLIGLFIDFGVSIERLTFTGFVYAFAVSGVAYVAYRLEMVKQKANGVVHPPLDGRDP